MADVASFAEAWIETCPSILMWFTIFMSPPSRRRGLKQQMLIKKKQSQTVASLAEAWIETVLF